MARSSVHWPIPAGPTGLSTPRRLAAVGALASTMLLSACYALGDSLTYLGSGGNTYWYLATASDFGWSSGDVIALSGLQEVTGANEPFGFSTAYTPSSVTWTCIQNRFGVTFFSLQSTATVAAPVSYSIVSADPSTGFVAGPVYGPEPTTMVMFFGGLMALGAVVWRRSQAPRRPR